MLEAVKWQYNQGRDANLFSTLVAPRSPHIAYIHLHPFEPAAGCRKKTDKKVDVSLCSCILYIEHMNTASCMNVRGIRQ